MLENKEEAPINIYSDALKHVLCGALVHLDAISNEIRKLDIKPEMKDNDPERYKRARMLHLTLVAINDIIHPAHSQLYEYFKGNDDFFNGLVDSFSKAKADGLTFKGCMCDKCIPKKDS